MIVCNGKEYATLAELSKECGVPVPTLERRCNKGVPDFLLVRKGRLPVFEEFWGETLERESLGVSEQDWKKLRVEFSVADLLSDLDGCYRQLASCKWEYAGVTYPNRTVLCKELGLNYKLFCSRIAAGDAIDTAVEGSRKRRRRRVLEYDGVIYRGVPELARAYNLSEHMLSYRLNAGWSLDDAIHTPRVEQGARLKKSVTYRGVTYASIQELSAAVGVPAARISARLGYGWSLEAAVETPCARFHAAYTVEIDGVVYPSKKAACAAYGISVACVDRYVNMGLSLEDAIIMPCRRGRYVYEGEKFPSLKALARHLDISWHALSRNLKEGYTLEEACNLLKGQVVPRVKYGGNSALAQEFGCSVDAVRKIRRGLSGGSETELTDWLRRIYSDYPTEFHGRVFQSVAVACQELGLPLDIVRSRMKRVISFQQVVHDLFYVMGDTVFLCREDLMKSLGVSPSVFRRVYPGLVSNDAVVADCLELVGTRYTQSSGAGLTASLGRSNADIKHVVGCRNGFFVVYCAVCGRPLLLTEDEVRGFRHSESFCQSKTQDVLYSRGVTCSMFRSRLRLLGSYEKVLDYFLSYGLMGLAGCIHNLPDVLSVQLLCDGTYARIHCAECGRWVMLPIEEAKLFTHSDSCETNEWLCCPKVDGRKTRSLSKGIE